MFSAKRKRAIWDQLGYAHGRTTRDYEDPRVVVHACSAYSAYAKKRKTACGLWTEGAYWSPSKAGPDDRRNLIDQVLEQVGCEMCRQAVLSDDAAAGLAGSRFEP